MMSVLPLASALGCFGTGVHMMLKTHAYIGTGLPPARDPQTVAWFGRFFAVLGAAPLVLVLFKFVSE